MERRAGSAPRSGPVCLLGLDNLPAAMEIARAGSRDAWPGWPSALLARLGRRGARRQRLVGQREHRLEELAGGGALDLRDLLGGALGDDLAAGVAAFGAEVDDPVGALDDVEVVLDDDDGVAGVDEALQDAEQVLDVVHVQARRRLVEDVERAPGAALGQLGGQLDALRLAAAELGRGLAEADVADRKSTRLNSSHGHTSYAGFSLK